MTISGSDRFVAVVAEYGTIKIPLSFASAGTALEVIKKPVRMRRGKKVKLLAFAEKFRVFLRDMESDNEKYRHIMGKHA